MGRAFFLAAVLLVGVAGAARADVHEDLIREYCAPGMGDERQAEIEGRLKRTGASRLRQPLKRLAPELDGPMLARLLVRLGHPPDTWKLVAPKLDGPDGDQVLVELLAPEFPLDELLDVWSAAPRGSRRAEIIEGGLLSKHDWITRNAKRLAVAMEDDDSPCREGAARLLAIVLGLQPGTGMNAVREEWRRVRDQWDLEALYDFRYRNGGLLGCMEKHGQIVPRGGNTFCAPGSYGVCVGELESYELRTHEVTVRFCGDRDGFVIGYGSPAGGAWEVKQKDGQAVTTYGDGRERSLPMRYGWHEVKFHVEVSDPTTKARTVSIYVDGHELMSGGSLNGSGLRLYISAHDGSVTLADAAVYEVQLEDPQRRGR